MSEDAVNPEIPEGQKTDEQDGLAHVRAQADRLGIKYHHRAGISKIQETINQHFAAENKAEGFPEEHFPESVAKDTTGPGRSTDPRDLPEVIPISEADYRHKRLMETRRECSQLIRVRIQCMNPAKAKWPGEIISVGSAKLGTFKKYIPYGLAEPWHIPKIIYDALLEKQCSIFYTAVGDKGHKTRKSRLVPEYNIVVLPPLTPVELKELARRQAMAAGQETVA
jgi:hypothetical protein